MNVLAVGKIPSSCVIGCHGVRKSLVSKKNLKFQLSSRDSMAAKYTVRQAVELLFDDEFGLSDGDTSKEEGEEVYSYRGGESLSKEAVENLGREVDTVTGGDSFSASSQEESEK